MSTSSISPVVPARIGTLLVPVGDVGKAKFDSYVERLQPENVIRLGDISPDSAGDRSKGQCVEVLSIELTAPLDMFTPLAFPNGVMLYNFITARPNEAHAGLTPFELFREALVVVGVVDGSNLSLKDGFSSPDSKDVSDSGSSFFESIEKELIEMRQEYSEAFLVQPVVFDYESTNEKRPPFNILTVPTVEKSRSTTMRTVMCDLSARVLAEMTVLARSITSADFISSPAIAKATSPLKELRTSARDAAQHEESAVDRRSQDSVDTVRARSNQTHLSAEERERRRASSPSPFPGPGRIERSVSPAPNRSNSRLSRSSTLDLRERASDRGGDRPTSSGVTRDSSRDRRGVQSLIVSASERAHNRLKSRQGLVIGNLYLLAGRWSDALRELVDNATRAKVFADWIWYAKGLENILVTMILLAWARIDFTIPPICYTNPEKYASTNRPGRSTSFTRSSVSTDMSSEEADRSLANLSVVSPDIIHTVIDAQHRARTYVEDTIPQFAYSECVVRMTHVLAILYRSDSTLNSRHLNYFVRGVRLPHLTSSLKMRHVSGTGRDIASLVFEAFPTELFSSSMPLEEIVTILSGIVSVLSIAGLYRKRALIIREALSILIPRLIQARKVGAAEMGIHPAASLAARHGLNADAAAGTGVGPVEADQGFHSMLVLLCNTFGVLGGSDMYRSLDGHSRNSKHESQQSETGGMTAADVILAQENDRRHFGGQALKLDVLRLSANFSEALPNFVDTIHFTAALLKTTGPGSAPPTDRMDHEIYLPPEEQARFASKIHRTLGSFTTADAARLETRYWDRYLVRDIELLAPDGTSSLKPLSRSRIDVAAQDPSTPRPTGPLIFNPSMRDSKITPQNVVVAEESAEFLVTLQNLYDLDVVIERLELVTEGVTFKSSSESFTLMARRRQQVLISGTAKSAGQLTITACRVKVHGCCEEVFPIYRQSWNPTSNLKVKETGLSALSASLSRPKSLVGPAPAAVRGPQSVKCTFRVIPVQPQLEVSGHTVGQSGLDVFSGETKSFQISLRNTSDSISIDFFRVSFVHTFSGSDRKAASQDQSNESLPLTRLEPMRKRPSESILSSIDPLESVAMDIDFLGIEGLQESTVQIDYGFLGNVEDDSSSLYCRRESLPFQVSVNPAAQLDDAQVVAASEQPNTMSTSSRKSLMLDLSNPRPSETVVTVADQHGHEGEQRIPPFATSRLFIAVPDAKPILHLGNEASHTTAANLDKALRDALTRDAHSEAVQAHLSVTWRDASTSRTGKIDASPIYHLLHTRCNDKIALTLDIAPADGSTRPHPTAPHAIPLHEGALLRATLHNRSSASVLPHITFELRTARPGDDVNRHVAYTGLLQRPLPAVNADGSGAASLGLCPLVRGRFWVAVTVREISRAMLASGWTQGVARAAVVGRAEVEVWAS